MSKTTAPATITLVTGFERTNGQRTPVTAEIKAGDFLSESLVTDTLVYEVVKVTAKTITVRPTTGGGPVHEDERCDKGANGLSVVWEEQVAKPEAKTRTLRVRKDGTIRSGSHVGARPFYPTRKVNGVPVRRVDYRM